MATPLHLAHGEVACGFQILNTMSLEHSQQPGFLV